MTIGRGGRTWGALVSGVVATVLATGGCTLPGQAPPSDTITGTAAAERMSRGVVLPAPAASRRMLDELRVGRDRSMAGYSRERFPHWRPARSTGWDAGVAPGCSAREAALLRDGDDVRATRSGCAVRRGRWLDPYTATWSSDPRTGVDIDHVVPLAEAWRSGANRWDDARRRRFANDPLVLVSVQASANRAKGDKGPDAWKPANRDVHCDYARRYVLVKTTYRLSSTAAEKKALADMLGTCRR